jgi:SAM-dependent methyltransferase
MGLDALGLRFLLFAKRRGVAFAHTAMIGRQSLNLDADALAAAFGQFGEALPSGGAAEVLTARNGYAEPLFDALGATLVHSFDAAPYEQATHLHDFNQPIATTHHAQYSAVLDGGTLEHVFNFPVALANAMQMVRPGGHFLGILTANNFLGHGFYQLSPELFHSALSEPNGYVLEHLIAVEDRPGAPWYAVASPDAVRERVTLVNRHPLYLLVIARRTQAVVPFATAPQQSDYQAMWAADAPAARRRQRPAWVTAVSHVVVRPVMRGIRRLTGNDSDTFNRRHYRRFDPTE